MLVTERYESLHKSNKLFVCPKQNKKQGKRSLCLYKCSELWKTKTNTLSGCFTKLLPLNK